MFEQFTSSARTVVQTALAKADSLQEKEVTADHLLLALCETPLSSDILAAHDITAAEIATALTEARRRGGLSEQDTHALNALGIDVAEVIDRVERSHGPDALARPRLPRRKWLFPKGTTFTREARKVLEQSLREAQDLGHRHIGEEHILLGVLSTGGVAADVLRTRGLTQAAIRTTLSKAS